VTPATRSVVPTLSAPRSGPRHAARLGAPDAQLPGLPPPAPVGFAGSPAGSAGSGLTLLLYAVAAALVAAVLPRLGRRASLRLAAPRTYRYLLRLERPD
jgi:hypothetical protein